MLEALRKMRFRKKLAITYLIMVIIPVLSLGFFAYTMSGSLLNQQLNAMLGASNRQLAHFLSNRLDKNNEFIRFTAFSPYLMEDFNGAPKNWYSISRKINYYFEPVSWYNMVQNPDFSQLRIYFEYLDKSVGTFIFPSSQVSGQAWYERACKSQRTEWFFQDGELYAARRIWNAPLDLLLGTVCMKMDFRSIMDSLVAMQEDGNGAILTDADGAVLYAADAGAEKAPEDLRALVEGAGKSVRLGGAKYFVTSQPVPGYGWSLYSYAPIDSFTSQRGRIIYIVTLIIGGCIVILLGLTRVFSSTMVKRLELLSDRMSRIGGLEKQNIAPVKIKDEVGILTERFGELLGQVYKSELILKEEELKTLQAQISPHFLYNTLSLINCKAIESDNAEIGRIAGLISTFYRTCLNKGQSLICIGDEINNIKSYIDLQLIMHDGGFDVEYDIDERALAFKTVNFTLQPLVENAIIHGMDENENARGRLLIRAEMTAENEILFTIEDNGIGMDGETLERIFSSEGEGYGIKNADQRIKLYFGEAYGIRLSSVLGEGTSATLLIPAQT
jgi:two-component system sensor histidine kinase YesM